ncbi:MAG: class I SAM-dependent methyltransferase [Pseudomonas sp.]
MSSQPHALKNWFDQGGQAYARFRPHYPAELAAYLAEVAPDTTLAVDVGCGNGQLTGQLARHFSTVIGLDPSADQVAHATPAANIDYRCAPAEQLPLADASASLVTAAQAAHWFDLPAFYAEVRRIGAPGAVLALISYGVLRLDEQLDARFQDFYWREIGPYWPAERQLVDSGYATLDFPFTPLAPPSLAINVEWTLAEFLGYVATWSAVRGAREAGREEILQRFASDIAALWGEPQTKRAVAWPIAMRVGRIHDAV